METQWEYYQAESTETYYFYDQKGPKWSESIYLMVLLTAVVMVVIGFILGLIFTKWRKRVKRQQRQSEGDYP